MPSRSQLPTEDRAARSQLLKLLGAANPLARASLVSMARACGKKNCKCAKGQKHVSLYLSTRVGKSRKMIYVPTELERHARVLVENFRAVEELIEEMSQASLKRFLDHKAKRASR
jgi:hypothetical protein